MNGWFLIFDDGRHRWEVRIATSPPSTLDTLDSGQPDGEIRWKRITMSAVAGVAAFYPEPEEVPV